MESMIIISRKNPKRTIEVIATDKIHRFFFSFLFYRFLFPFLFFDTATLEIME